MSAETKAAVDRAIRAHLADECDEEPWLLTDWYVICAPSDSSMERTNYLHIRSEAPTHIHMGLVHLAQRNLDEHLLDGDA